eukprot:3316047-Pleurochrysis_carterae.AAC.1
MNDRSRLRVATTCACASGRHAKDRVGAGACGQDAPLPPRSPALSPPSILCACAPCTTGTYTHCSRAAQVFPSNIAGNTVSCTGAQFCGLAMIETKANADRRAISGGAVSYTHLRAHETDSYL